MNAKKVDYPAKLVGYRIDVVHEHIVLFEDIPVLFNEGFVNGPSRWHIDPEKNMGMFMDDAAHPADWLLWMFGRDLARALKVYWQERG